MIWQNWFFVQVNCFLATYHLDLVKKIKKNSLLLAGTLIFKFAKTAQMYSLNIE